jgi:hypothetical protein
VSACRSSGWQAANKSFARIGQTNRSRLNQVASVDPTEARDEIASPYATSIAIGSSVQPIVRNSSRNSSVHEFARREAGSDNRDWCVLTGV